MPRTPEQNEAIREKRRKKLLKVSLERFAVLGYDDLTIDHITKASGCSHGLFYHYFKDKPTVFKAIVKEYMGEGAVLPPVEEAKEAGGIKGLKVFCDYLTRLADDQIENVYIAKILAGLSDSEDVDPTLEPVILANQVKQTIADLVEQGQKDGDVVSGDPIEIAEAFLCILDGTLDNRISKSSARLVKGDVVYGFLLSHQEA